MSGVSGIVKAVIGQVFAVSPDGSKRLLTEGDRVLEGEHVQTGAAGAITLSLPDGKQLDLGRDSQWDSSGHIVAEATATQQQDVAAIQQAIADGQDPTQTLEATAAIRNPVILAASQAAAAAGHIPTSCSILPAKLLIPLRVTQRSAWISPMMSPRKN